MSLGEFHHHEETNTKASKITSWAVIALILGALAFYVVDSGFFSPQTAQSAKTYPRAL